MPPGELWWLIDAKMPKSGPGIAANDIEDLYQALQAAKAAEVA